MTGAGATSGAAGILTSDNGGMLNIGGQAAWKLGHRLNGDLLGFKFDAWEGGHRVPFIARWPGRITPATSSDSPTSQGSKPDRYQPSKASPRATPWINVVRKSDQALQRCRDHHPKPLSIRSRQLFSSISSNRICSCFRPSFNSPTESALCEWAVSSTKSFSL